MLRASLIVVSVLLLAGALSLFLNGQTWPAACVVTLEAAVIFGGVVFERRRYKKVLDQPPVGEGWAITPERFIDPATGAEVVVWFNAAAGRRAYVRAG